MWIDVIIRLIQDFWTTTLIVAIVIYFAFRIWNYHIKKYITNKVRQPKDHYFFSKIKRDIELLIPNIRLSYDWKYSEWRTKIFRDMLIVKFKIWKRILKETIHEKWDLNNIWQDAIIDIYKWYIEEWDKVWIPNIVIDKFNSWHSQHIKIYQKAIERIFSWDCFSSKEEKINAILEISITMIILTLSDAEQTLWSINWDLSWLEYKWVTII